MWDDIGSNIATQYIKEIAKEMDVRYLEQIGVSLVYDAVRDFTKTEDMEHALIPTKTILKKTGELVFQKSQDKRFYNLISLQIKEIIYNISNAVSQSIEQGIKDELKRLNSIQIKAWDETGTILSLEQALAMDTDSNV
jgi:hypothetical protein